MIFWEWLQSFCGSSRQNKTWRGDVTRDNCRHLGQKRPSYCSSPLPSQICSLGQTKQFSKWLYHSKKLRSSVGIIWIILVLVFIAIRIFSKYGTQTSIVLAKSLPVNVASIVLVSLVSTKFTAIPQQVSSDCRTNVCYSVSRCFAKNILCSTLIVNPPLWFYGA